MTNSKMCVLFTSRRTQYNKCLKHTFSTLFLVYLPNCRFRYRYRCVSYIYIYIYIYTCVCMFVCVYIHTYIYIYIYIHSSGDGRLPAAADGGPDPASVTNDNVSNYTIMNNGNNNNNHNNVDTHNVTTTTTTNNNDNTNNRTCMTKHNHIHYRISRVCIDMDPTTTFPFEEGQISYLEYFQRRHGIALQRRQPLLHCPFRGKQELKGGSRAITQTSLDFL